MKSPRSEEQSCISMENDTEPPQSDHQHTRRCLFKSPIPTSTDNKLGFMCVSELNSLEELESATFAFENTVDLTDDEHEITLDFNRRVEEVHVISNLEESYNSAEWIPTPFQTVQSSTEDFEQPFTKSKCANNIKKDVVDNVIKKYITGLLFMSPF